MIKNIEEGETYYHLTEVDENFTFEDKKGNKIFPNYDGGVSEMKIGKNWPIRGLVFSEPNKIGRLEVIEDERIRYKLAHQVHKWRPHNKELVQDILEALEMGDGFDLLELPRPIEAYFSDNHLIIFYKGDEKIEVDKDLFWAANSIDYIISLYWVHDDKLDKRLWHKNKDKPRFPERKPKWTKRDNFDLKSEEERFEAFKNVAHYLSNGFKKIRIGG